jgi:tRNA-specific 2-thiouridylase
MSGGVDSSIAATLLVQQGYEVIGVMMRLWAEEPALNETEGLAPSGVEGANRCCTPEAVDDARRVAAQLDIPFYLVNYEREFKACVVDFFVREYSQGRTPNPCLACNRHIRFGRLLGHAQALDADFLATGHYARVERVDGLYRLQKGADPQKDQSYMLYVLGQDELRQVLFPIGHYTKAQVREIARQHGLPVAERDESMDLCFVSDDDYRRFLREHAAQAIQPGPILDSAGHRIGQHKGLPFYTVGQRRGLGIAASEALYVLRLDVEHNALIVGTAQELGQRSLIATEVNYPSGPPSTRPTRVEAKIRYRARPAEATWTPLDRSGAKVEFDSPLRDITPGQAVVAYQGNVVLAGGIISG